MATDFESLLRELLTLYEKLKVIKKDLERFEKNLKVEDLQNLSKKIEELNKTLSIWYTPEELNPKLEKLKKELALTVRLLEDLQKNLEFVNRNLYLKPKKYSYLFLCIAFLVGVLTGTFLTLFIFKQKPIVNLNGLKFETENNCIIPTSGRLIFSLQGKNYEIDTKQIKVKICSK
jgi:hypothetical protein